MMPVKIVCSDSLSFMRRMRAAIIDLVVTSPPYNIGKEYEERVAMERYAEWIFPIVEASVRVMKDGAWSCWQVGNHVTGTAKKREVLPLDFVFIPMLARAGLTCRQRIVWTFGHGLHNRYSFSGRHETLLCFSKGKPRRPIEPMIRAGGNVWNVTNVKNNHPEKTEHPCQFPEALIAPLVYYLTDPGDKVLDPFSGAGTTGAVAAKHGRDAIVIDAEPRYCAIAAERITRREGHPSRPQQRFT